VSAAATAPAGAVAAARAGDTGLERRWVRTAWLFLAPMLGVLVLVAAWPLARTIWLGLTDARLGDDATGAFVGFANFAYLLTDPDWWVAVRNTIVFTVSSVTLEAVLGLTVALALNRAFRGRGIVRAAVLVPWAIPTVVSAKMWEWMLNDVYGVINAMLLAVGLIATSIAWTASPSTAMLAIVMVDVWKTTPFVALLLLAGLQTIPADVYEAARIDGATPVQIFFRVTLPLLMPALLVALIFRTLDALRVFDVVYVMTGNNKATMTMSVYARQQLVDFQDVGFGSAAATLLFAIVALFTVVYVTAGKVARDT
jgi:trehalose/maltose transport system permease protein